MFNMSHDKTRRILDAVNDMSLGKDVFVVAIDSKDVSLIREKVVTLIRIAFNVEPVVKKVITTKVSFGDKGVMEIYTHKQYVTLKRLSEGFQL